MVLSKDEKIKELQAVLLKLDREYDELGKVLDALEVKKKDATAEEAVSIAKEIKQFEFDRLKSFEEQEETLRQLLFLKYRSPNFKYFDLPLDEKIIDEHFKKVERAGGEWRSELWEELFDYDYYADKIANSEVEKYDFRANKYIKVKKLKQPNLFYYADAFDAHYVDIILALIKRVVKFRFVNGICNTVFHGTGGHPRDDDIFDNYFFRLPIINDVEESFARRYALPLYHLVPRRRIIELHERYAEYKKEVEERGYSLFYRTESFKKRKEQLSDRSTLVDYYIYSCDAFDEYLVNFSSKYFAYNIARFLVKNVAFLPNALVYGSSNFVLFFPDTFDLSPLVSDAIVRETIKHLEQIFASLDVFKANSTISISRFACGCSCSFSFIPTSRPFKFTISVGGHSDNLNYPYRSFYMPDCKESDEEFINKIPMRDRLGKLSYVDLWDKDDRYTYKLYSFCWPSNVYNNYPGFGHYILNMVKSEIDYYNLEVKEPFSLERFKQQVEELRKKAAYNSFYDHYSFLIADTAFYQFEKYLEYELEQHKIRNNINYEQMLEERKEKENKFSFFGYGLTVLRKDF
jgi:hypothetical protein